MGRLIGAGFGLLALVIVVAIMLQMGAKDAEQAVEAKKSLEKQITENIQQPALGRGAHQIAQPALPATQPAEPGQPAAPKVVTYQVVLTDAGDNLLDVIDIVAKANEQDVRSAGNLVASAPAMVRTGMTKEQADALARQFQAAGAKAEVRPSN